jgi:hypothetical protein
MDNTILIFAIILLALIIFTSILKHKYNKPDKENMNSIFDFVKGCGRSLDGTIKPHFKSFIQKKTEQELKQISREEGRVPTTQQEPCGGTGQPPCITRPNIVPLGEDELEIPPFVWSNGIFDFVRPDS